MYCPEQKVLFAVSSERLALESHCEIGSVLPRQWVISLHTCRKRGSAWSSLQGCWWMVTDYSDGRMWLNYSFSFFYPLLEFCKAAIMLTVILKSMICWQSGFNGALKHPLCGSNCLLTVVQYPYPPPMLSLSLPPLTLSAILRDLYFLALNTAMAANVRLQDDCSSEFNCFTLAKLKIATNWSLTHNSQTA